MGFTPWYQGDTRKPLTIQCVPDSGYYDFTGLVPSNFTISFHNINTGNITLGTGTFSSVTLAVVSGGIVTSPAQVTYAFSTADVATIGIFEVWVDFGTTGNMQTVDLGRWQVTAL